MLRISYFDVVGKAVGHLRDREVGAAITRLSAAYRAGASELDFGSEVGRAAYLWHHLPAHVCDVARLLLDHRELLDRERLRVLCLGAGPGSDGLAVLDAATRLRAEGELEGLRRLELVRLDAARGWDRAFAALLPHALAAARQRDPTLEAEWTLEANPRAVVADLTRPLPDAARDEVAAADLVLAANLLTELAPRGTDELPGAGRAAFAALLAALRPEAALLVLDRAGAPGAAARVAEVAALAREAGRQASAPRERATKCACTLTRRAKQVYAHVRLPTTREADRPVRNCKTVWFRA